MDATPKGMEAHGAEFPSRGASHCDYDTFFENHVISRQFKFPTALVILIVK